MLTRTIKWSWLKAWAMQIARRRGMKKAIVDDIVFLFDVTNGNPNGDPDAGNQPRMDPETRVGLVSDVSLKRKIRNYTELSRGDRPGYRIYVQEGSILNEKHREAYKAVRNGNDKVAKEKSLNPQSDEEAKALTKFMCDNFFDVRTFGAVMSTGINAGQVRGPVQIAFAKSVETILPMEISITRMAATNEKEKADREKGEDNSERTENRTMGRKHVVLTGFTGRTSSSMPSWPSAPALGRKTSITFSTR
jgi:CRISPR-associated protein Csd2